MDMSDLTIIMKYPEGATDADKRQIVKDTLDPRYMPYPITLICEIGGCPGHVFDHYTFPLEDLDCDGCGYELIKWQVA